MKFFMLALVMMSFQAQAQQVIEVSCEGPDLGYLNRFDLNMKIEMATNGEETKVENQALEGRFTKSGYDARSQRVSVEGLKGIAKASEGGLTKKPYYQIQLVDKEQGVRVFINADYPSKLNSSIQLSNGLSYKSNCTTL